MRRARARKHQRGPDGDLVLTCTDDQSRNRRFGLALAAGASADEAREQIGQVVEGYYAARAVHHVAARAGHFLAYATAQIHDVRATLWTFSSLSVLIMTGYVLVQAI